MAETQIPIQDSVPAAPPQPTDAPAPVELLVDDAAEPQEPTFDIPKECKAGVIYNIGPDFEIKVEMVPVPTPGPTDLLVKLNCTGICYSDVHFMLSDLNAPPMSFFGVRSPGHEGAGIVETR